MKVGKSWGDASHTTEGSVDTQEDSLSAKCAVLNDKLDLLLRALHEESVVSISSVSSTTAEESSLVEEVGDRLTKVTASIFYDFLFISRIHHNHHSERHVQYLQGSALV